MPLRSKKGTTRTVDMRRKHLSLQESLRIQTSTNTSETTGTFYTASLFHVSEKRNSNRYFNAYMQFFTLYIKEHGISKALEEFIFSRRSNLGSDTLSPDKQPQMLSRFLSGVVHPLIHTGYGAEFRIPGMAVEGNSSLPVITCCVSTIRGLRSRTNLGALLFP